MDNFVFNEILLDFLLLVHETAGMRFLNPFIIPLFDLWVSLIIYLFSKMSPVFAGKSQSVDCECILRMVFEIVERKM